MDEDTILLVVGVVLLALIVVATGLVLWQAHRIRRSPDPELLQRLRADPPGTATYLERPDGARLHVTDAPGDEATVVLLHGYALASASWNLVATDLVDRGHRVVTLDWRAHGASSNGTIVTTEAVVDDLVAVLEHLEVDDAVLVGHSTGGYVALTALLDHPGLVDRVRGLVLVASLAGDVLTENPDSKLRFLRNGAVQRLVGNETLGLLVAASVQGPQLEASVAQAFLDQVAQTHHPSVVALLSELVARSRYDELASLDLPVVVVCGSEDGITPPPHSERLARELDARETVEVAGAGHLLNWQHPDVVVDAVVSLATDPG